jgi:hypothetical protein
VWSSTLTLVRAVPLWSSRSILPWLGALLAFAVIALAAPAAQADFGVAKFEAGTCNTDTLTEECSYTAPQSQFYTQAAGHPPIGLTGFEVNTQPGLLGNEPIGNVKDIRVDVPPGLSVNPQATCSRAELESGTCAGKGQCTQEQFEHALCPAASVVGSDELDAFLALIEIDHVSVPMYNLVPPQGVPAEFGLEINVPGVIDAKILIVGGLSWYKEAPTGENSGVPTGDYHEYFKIENVPNTVGIIKTRLKFTGTAGDGTFITLPSVCSTQTSYLHVDSYEAPGQFLGYSTLSGYPPKPISVGGCDKVPFAPSLSLKLGGSEGAPDQPTGLTGDLHIPQSKSPSTLNNSDLKDAHITLPEGLTLNPSAAHGLEACTEAQIGIGTNAAVGCPSGSLLGSVAIETPVLPPKSLEGQVFLGDPSGGPITGPPFTIYLALESERYGVGVRLKGTAAPDPNTGQLTVTFPEAPQLPFEDVVFKLKGTARAPLASPLVCAPVPVSALQPYTGQAPVGVASSSPFSPGTGSVCLPTAPFSLAQGTHTESPDAGAYTKYTFSLARADAQQYLSQIKTVLPAGLLGAIPSVGLCGEPQASQGSCPSASQIGVATVAAGAGGEPYTFAGSVFLTGPYGGAPYGLSIVIPAVAGPFNFGLVVTRAAIAVDPKTARIIVTSALPTIVKGVPLRLRSINVTVNRENFLFNPTNCGALATETTLTSTFAATQSLTSPFQVGNCGALAFKPAFKASGSAKTSRANGASLRVTLSQPARQANIHSVFVQLPKQLPTRTSTLQKACLEATFAANPSSCPSGSRVGSATVVTPVLPGKLLGTAYIVSHGGAAFPDLDLVLDGDGVRVILVGNTNIAHGVTSSTFAAIPDVPVSSFTLDLPVGPSSILAAHGDLCTASLQMPTTILAQNGSQFKQQTRISVSGCGVRILRHKVVGHAVRVTLQAFAGGRISIGGPDLRSIAHRLGKAGKVTLKVPLSKRGIRALNRRHKLKIHLRVGFLSNSSHSKSKALAVVTFRA